MADEVVAHTKHGDLTLDQVAEIQPGMSRLMAELANRFTVSSGMLLTALTCQGVELRSRGTRPSFLRHGRFLPSVLSCGHEVNRRGLGEAGQGRGARKTSRSENP